MRKKYKLKKEFKRLLILFLGMALATQLVGNSVVFAMNDASDVIATYEVGVEGNNVLATLTKDGTITLSGSGDTKDYTSDTMPFQDNISNIKDIVIEEGVTSIGNAMFYNCKDINGKLIIPSTVVEIGDYAFAGDAYDLAPKITKIENSFTQSNIVVETPVEKKSEESTTEKSAEEQTTPATEEPTADTTQQDATPKQEEQPVQETVKTVKTITEQQIGQSVFVSGQNGGYSCAETNKSFIDAVKEAGYVRADRFVLVRMDSSITQEVPVINGQLVLPSKPDTLGVPAEDALTSYQFAGWTVEGSDNVLNPKDNYSISDGVEELNLTSQWQQTWKINPQVKTEAKEEASIYSAVDRNTGNVLENVNGYIMTVQWQINRKDKEDENSWENIENATSFTYERKAEAGDTKSYFRAKVSITKQSKLRTVQQTEIMTTDVVNGVSDSKAITVIYNPGAGASGNMNSETIDAKKVYKLKDSEFTGSNNKTFAGWYITLENLKVTVDGQAVSSNDILSSHKTLELEVIDSNFASSITLTAQWKSETVIYLDPVNGDDAKTGLTAAEAVRTVTKAYGLLPADGTMETNKIILLDTLTIASNLNFPSKHTTITANEITDKNDIVLNDGIAAQFNGNTKLERLTLYNPTDADIGKDHSGFFGGGHEFVLGDGIITNGNVRVLGGNAEFSGNLTGDTHITVYSGSYTRVVGGGYNKNITGSTYVTTFGGSGNIYGSNVGVKTTTVTGNTNIKRYDGNYYILGGGRYGYVNGMNGYSTKIQIYGGDGPIKGACASGVAGMMRSKVLIYVYGGNVSAITGGADEGNNNKPNITPLADGSLIEIYGGTIGTLLGGGNDGGKQSVYPSVKGNIDIHVYGGTINDTLISASRSGRVSNGNVSVTLENCIINGDIYIGGVGGYKTDYYGDTWYECAVTDNDSNLTINDNVIINGNIYCGGQVYSTIHGNSTITINGSVSKSNPSEKIEIFAGGNGKDTLIEGISTISIANGVVLNANIYGGGQDGKSSNSIININGKLNGNIFGGGKGEVSSVTKATVNIESTANITGDIFGGGELGVVETSNVNLNGGTIAGNVFGGGNNVGVTTSNVNVNGTTNLTQDDSAIFGGSNAKGTTNESNIIINCHGIQKNIYGGGLGSETTVGKSTVNLTESADISGHVYGGGKEGKVTDTEIKLASGATATDIFGGGHFVGVDNSVKITSEKNSNASNIYGGSNESGIVKNPLVTIAGNVENVYGAGKGSGTTTENPSVTLTGGDTVVSNAVYGGGEKGVSTGLAKVTLTNGANNIENIYGAGNDAGIQGDTEISISEDSTANYVYGGSNNTGEVTGKATVKISGKAISDVFGGGKGANTIVNNSYVETSTTSHIDGNVFGGSDQGIITTNTEMQIDGIILGSIYGAGKGASSNVMGNTHVVLFGATVTGDVFGGGNLGGIAGDSHVDLLSGTVEGSAFGGSNQALVHGNSKVHMGYSATDNQKNPNVMKMIVKKSIYGGGNITDSGKAFDASNPFVLGNSEVLINQEGYSTLDADFQIGENILGDGNMCVTAGDKIISITNYKGINNKKTLASIQRATTLSLDGSWIELTGSKDSANLLPTMEYSLSRIDTLRLNGNSTLNLYREVNLVRSLESYFNGSPASESDAKGGGNSIILQQGIGLELRTNEDVSRPGYGAVIGYTRLGRYDKDGKDLMDGVYVLGGYDATNNVYGFVANEDIMEKPGDTTPTIKAGDKLTPETNNQTWNNWRLGRRVDIVTRQIVVSDRPSLGKSIEIRSKWAADGSIYKIDKDSLTISYQNGSNENFTFVDPDKLSSGSGDVNSTFGLEIGTGQNGWLEQNKAGYVEGSTSGSTNTMVLQKDGEMTAIKNDQVYPLISVTLSNLTGITKSDAKVPVRVSFNVNTYTKQADGTDMKTGTMTINIDIIRNPQATYSDTTLEAGKNYKGAIKAYDYDTEKDSALTISETSSITLQYARKAKDGTAAPTRNELSFSTALPNNTKILMIDKSGNDTKYYNYKVTDTAGKLKIDLSEFVENGTAAGKYKPISSGNDAENYIFIIDFAHVVPRTMNNIKATLIAYNGTDKISDKSIVFSVSGDQRIYTLTSKQNDPSVFNRYSIGSTIPIDLTTTVTVGSGQIDTTGREKQMGARVRLYSVDNQSYINIPSTWEVISQGTHYSAGGNSFTIKLADGLTVTESKIYIQMSSIGNLPIGKYQLKVDLIGGALANYPEDDKALATEVITIGIELTDYSYSIKSTMADENKQLFSNTTSDKTVDIKLEKATSAGASTTGVYVQQTLYKKNENNGEYGPVDLTELFELSSLPQLNGKVQNKLAWDKNLLSYKYKDDIAPGTYRLQFDVMQADAFNDLTVSKDVVRASDTINIVVTDD